MMMMMMMLMEVMQTSSAYTDTCCVVHFKLEYLPFCAGILLRTPAVFPH